MLSFRNFSLVILLIAGFSFFTFAQSKQKVDFTKKIEQSTLAPLPQSPVVKKLKSDAEDENLKGKVKSIVEERQEFTGVGKDVGRRFSSIAEYNESGNELKTVSFEYRGRPYLVTVYGYIDGARVSNSQSITDENTLRTVGTPKAKKEESPSKPDSRYEYKYEYKYANGKLDEMQMFNNDGTKGMRYVYNYKGKQMEKLAYTDDGELNQKYLTIYDDKGNEIEFIYFHLWQRNGENTRYSIKIDSFDNEGNWTKKTAYEVKTVNGKQISELSSITYRTITYYP